MMLNLAAAGWKMSYFFAVGWGEEVLELHSGLGQTDMVLHKFGISCDICFG